MALLWGSACISSSTQENSQLEESHLDFDLILIAFIQSVHMELGLEASSQTCLRRQASFHLLRLGMPSFFG